MFGSTALEVAIGLVLTFLLFSLILTAARETAEAFFKTRGSDLEKAIAELLQDQEGKDLRKEFYEHPLIFALYRGKFPEDNLEGKKRGKWKDAPSYIPTAQAVSALMDLWLQSKLTGPVGHALNTLSSEAQGDIELMRKKVGNWYDAAMDRISGAYRRHTQKWLLVIGLFLAAALNMDALAIARSLANDPSLRSAYLTVADNVAQRQKTEEPGQNGAGAADSTTGSQSTVPVTVDELVVDLSDVGVPFGWFDAKWPQDVGENGGEVLNWFLFVCQKILGFLIMALAGTLGAPFWFDTLQRLVAIRSTLKPAPEDDSRKPASGTPDSVPTLPGKAPEAASLPTGGAGDGPIPDRTTTFNYG